LFKRGWKHPSWGLKTPQKGYLLGIHPEGTPGEGCRFFLVKRKRFAVGSRSARSSWQGRAACFVEGAKKPTMSGCFVIYAAPAATPFAGTKGLRDVELLSDKEGTERTVLFPGRRLRDEFREPQRAPMNAFSSQDEEWLLRTRKRIGDRTAAILRGRGTSLCQPAGKTPREVRQSCFGTALQFDHFCHGRGAAGAFEIVIIALEVKGSVTTTRRNGLRGKILPGEALPYQFFQGLGRALFIGIYSTQKGLYTHIYADKKGGLHQITK